MASKIKVDNINKVSDDSNIIKKCGSTITIGSCGASVALASGATQTGFGTPTSSVLWCTTAKTSPFTAADKLGYFVNTTSGAVTVTLPSSPSVGDVVAIKDYAGTFQTNNVTVGRNGSKIAGACSDATLSTQGDSIKLVYVDGTQGWLNVQTDDTVTGALHIVATGGTITTSGDFKIHTFNSDGCFAVTNAGQPGGSTTVDYLVLAGGGGGASGGGAAGGGGAGGHRFSFPNPATGGFPVSAQTYPITVGGGGAGGAFSPGSCLDGTPGSTSTFSTISSAGGGGGLENGPVPAGNGGSGGGGSYQTTCGGAGNTPPVTPSQGNDGGTGALIAASNTSAGGGGGAGAVGVPGPSGVTGRAGTGGCGVANSITGAAVTRGGGGNAYGQKSPGGPLIYAPTPSPGGGGASPAGAGGTNLGGGGGGNATGNGGSGGSGVVIIRYKFQ